MTRKAAVGSTFRPGKKRCTCEAMTSSSSTKRVFSGIGTSRGTDSGILMMATMCARRARDFELQREIERKVRDEAETDAPDRWPAASGSARDRGEVLLERRDRALAEVGDALDADALSLRAPGSALRRGSGTSDRGGGGCAVANRSELSAVELRGAVATFAAMRSRISPTRIMKNSSRLCEQMLRNLTRSSSGTDSLSASPRTRRLNSIQLNSRSMSGMRASAEGLTAAGRAAATASGAGTTSPISDILGRCDLSEGDCRFRVNSVCRC